MKLTTYLGMALCAMSFSALSSSHLTNSDYSSGTSQYLQTVYACEKDNSCSESDLNTINLLKGQGEHSLANEAKRVGYTAEEFQRLLDHSDPAQRSYFIPLGLSKQELILFAASTSLGLVVFGQDEELMKVIQRNKTATTDKVSSIANLLGREVIPPVALGSYFLGAVFDNGKLKKLGLLTVSAGLATQMVTEVFKVNFGRRRPKAGVGAYKFKTKGKSFFSGHSSGAWSFATAVSEIYKDEHEWVPYLAYGAAALTSFARVHDKKHWVSDVLAGAVAGHLITKLMARAIEGDDTYGGLLIYPNADFETGAIKVNIEYRGERPEKKFKCSDLPQGVGRARACMQELF